MNTSDSNRDSLPAQGPPKGAQYSATGGAPLLAFPGMVGEIAFAGFAQKTHLALEILAPIANGQMHLELHLLGQAERPILAFRQQAGDFLTTQHGCSPAENQFFSRQRRKPLRARCRITLQLLVVMLNSWQTSLVSNSRNSRIMKTRAVFSGRCFRQASKTSQKRFSRKASSGLPQSLGRVSGLQWSLALNRDS